MYGADPPLALTVMLPLLFPQVGSTGAVVTVIVPEHCGGEIATKTKPPPSISLGSVAEIVKEPAEEAVV